MKASIAVLLTLGLSIMPLYCIAEESPPPAPAQEQPEVLTRGPVHEAFAEPIDLQTQAGLVAPKQPPANIEEIPATQRPEGDNYVWVPGYWAWDADRNNYIWVSACWRAAPPGMSWVPGYWSQASGGWEWIAGFWTPAGSAEIEYLPAPPAIDNTQPSGPPPSADQIWVPPCQYWYQGSYVMRPGYWLTPQPNWVWVPAHYNWTPRGYIFVGGRWDYPLRDRGVLFAPVSFPSSAYAAGYSYSPSIVVDIAGLELSLFAYPRYCHYYFGDYYDNAYLSAGIYPWFECERNHTWYDPIYFHDRWRYHSSNPHWAQEQRHEYERRRVDRDIRPARTYHEMETRIAKMPEPQRKNFRMAEPINTYASAKTSRYKFEKINSTTQHKIAEQASQVHNYGQQRSRWESQTTAQPAAPRKGAVTTPEHKAPATPPPAERREPVTTTPERKAPEVTPPVEHGQTPTTTERKAREVTPPAEHKEPITTTSERKAPEVTPPVEHRQAPTTTEHKAREVTPPAEHREPAQQAAQPKSEYVPPHEVHLSQPERVKVPPSSVSGKSGGAKGPPSQPANEHQNRGQTKEAPGRGESKDSQHTDQTKDKDQEKNK